MSKCFIGLDDFVSKKAIAEACKSFNKVSSGQREAFITEGVLVITHPLAWRHFYHHLDINIFEKRRILKEAKAFYLKQGLDHRFESIVLELLDELKRLDLSEHFKSSVLH